ncbi:MAG TPA: Fic family protein [Candidatus Polarisedimenticolia bacterium]|nr:Fic family protein [Candidatus Polarisedimenticolia bacterium]
MDWAAFSFEYRLEYPGEEVVSNLISIEAYKEAAQNLVLAPDWQEQLDRLNRVRAVYGTTALEGNPLSEAEVARQMDLLSRPGQGGNNVSREQRQIRNAGLAQVWVKTRFKQNSPPLTLDDILAIHKAITEQSDERDNVPGRLREHEVHVGSVDAGGIHRGAPAQRLQELMAGFVEFVNSRGLLAIHPVLRALLSHFFLVTIHPFGDGNGRVSRLVEAGILFQGGYNVHGFYGLSSYFYRHEREYKISLQACRNSQPFTVTPFVVFGLKGFASELKGINNFIKAKLNRVVYRAMLVRAFNSRIGTRRRLLNQREYNLLDFLLTKTEPTDPFSDEHAREISVDELKEDPYIKAVYGKVTPRTFLRELGRLAHFGFITFALDDGGKAIVRIDFEAIRKH